MARPRGFMGDRDASPDRRGLDGGQRLLLGAQEFRGAVVRRSPAARRPASPGTSRAPRTVDPASALHATRNYLAPLPSPFASTPMPWRGRAWRDSAIGLADRRLAESDNQISAVPENYISGH